MAGEIGVPEMQELQDTATAAEESSLQIGTAGASVKPDTTSPAAAQQITAAPEHEEEPPEPVDARMELRVTDDRMDAFLLAFAPQFGGKDLTAYQAKALLRERGVVYGLVGDAFESDEAILHYGDKIWVAHGTRPADGVDGKIVEYFARERDSRPKEDEKGNVDFKDLNIVTNIAKNAVICDLIQPVPAVPGKDVFGLVANGYEGKMPRLPVGWNTKVSQAKDKILADCDGNLVFVDGLYRVEDTLHIKGNINNEVGNIDFCGKLIIEGDVCEGFTIKSKRSIEIKGNVEGATVIAKESIKITKGMNGMGKGILEAAGDVNCRFLENAIVRAGGNIFAESVMNSTLYSDDSVRIEGRRGVLLGGTVTAKNLVEARVIGSGAHIPTIIVLGISQEMLADFRKTQTEFDRIQAEIEGLTKDIVYLEQRQVGNDLSQMRKDVLLEKRRQKTVNLMRSSALTRQLKRFQEHAESALTCRLKCGQIFPAVQIRIGNAKMTIRQMEPQCNFYYKDGAIIKGIL